MKKLDFDIYNIFLDKFSLMTLKLIIFNKYPSIIN